MPISIPTDEPFDHEAHVRLAWICLSRQPLPEAMIEFRDALKSFAAGAGASRKYHETLTFFFILLVHERMTDTSAEWPAFRDRNSDLISGWRSLVERLYGSLNKELLRTRFAWPESWRRLGL